MLTHCVTRNQLRCLSSYGYQRQKVKSVAGTQVFNLPLRKQRRSTDLLLAMSKTVRHDPSAARYQFVDEPHLIPTNDDAKRRFALSKEAGKKAARWIAEEWPTLFIQEEDEPRLYAFRPMKAMTEESETGSTESELLDRIARREIGAAWQIYDKITQMEGQLSNDTLLKLLQLLCYFNSKDPVGGDWRSEFWNSEAPPYSVQQKRFKRATAASEVAEAARRWDDGGPAEILWSTLNDEQRDADSYTAFICGLARFGEYERANELRLEAKANGVHVHACAYREIAAGIRQQIGDAHDNRDSDVDFQSMLQLIEALFVDMAEAQLKPDVIMFNCYLLALFHARRSEDTFEMGQSVLREMEEIGVEPSLGTYHLILQLAVTYRRVKRIAFAQTFAKLSNREFEFQDWVADAQFFPRTMQLIRTKVLLPDAAHKLHAILQFGANMKFLISLNAELLYYRTFLFALLNSGERPKVFFDALKDYVPNTITIPVPMFGEICDYIEHNHSYEYVPQVFELACAQNAHIQPEVVERFLRLMSGAVLSKWSGLWPEFATIALNLFQQIQLLKSLGRRSVEERVSQILNSLEMIQMSTLLCLRANNVDGVSRFLDHLASLHRRHLEDLWLQCESSLEQSEHSDVPVSATGSWSRDSASSWNAFLRIFDGLFAKQDVTNLLKLLQALDGKGQLAPERFPLTAYALANLAKEVSEQLPMTEEWLTQLRKYCSKDVQQSQQGENVLKGLG